MKKLPLLFLLVPALLALAAWAADRQPGFSRSRWLEEQQAWGARTSENLVPESPQRLKAFLDQLAHTKPPSTGIPKGVIRVSGDILSPDSGSVAQAETETEPFFAFD